MSENSGKGGGTRTCDPCLKRTGSQSPAADIQYLTAQIIQGCSRTAHLAWLRSIRSISKPLTEIRRLDEPPVWFDRLIYGLPT